MKNKVSVAEHTELFRLFGGQGRELRTRLGLSATATLDDAVKETVWDRHDYWARRKARAVGELLALCDHALSCLETILDALEEKSHD